MFTQKPEGPKAPPSKEKRLLVDRPSHRSHSGVRGGRRGSDWDALALRWVELEASVAQAYLEAVEEDLRGLVGAAGGAVVNVEGCHVHQTPSSVCLRKSFRDGTVEAQGKRQGPDRSSLLHTPSAGDLPLVRTRRSCTSRCTSPGQARFFGPRARSRTCRSGRWRGPWSSGIGLRRLGGAAATCGWSGRCRHIPGVMSLVTVSIRALAVRRLKVSPTTTRRCLRSFFSAASEALVDGCGQRR